MYKINRVKSLGEKHQKLIKIVIFRNLHHIPHFLTDLWGKLSHSLQKEKNFVKVPTFFTHLGSNKENCIPYIFGRQ